MKKPKVTKAELKELAELTEREAGISVVMNSLVQQGTIIAAQRHDLFERIRSRLHLIGIYHVNNKTGEVRQADSNDNPSR
ncbi:hypothetical protein LCGC14_0316510 [marine sediment metagenome]|uniref:Uncharacterized protein n=1 Tax=marine sediment metagenome TaxID=412755 RepID=A0A0F9TQV7_9ZZZZ